MGTVHPHPRKSLPEDFVQRSYEFNELVASLLDYEREEAIAITTALNVGLAATERPLLPMPSAMTSASRRRSTTAYSG